MGASSFEQLKSLEGDKMASAPTMALHPMTISEQKFKMATVIQNGCYCKANDGTLLPHAQWGEGA
jgi:hypothetical protein